MGGYWKTAYYPAPNAADIRNNAEESTKKAKRKGIVYHPVIIEGRKIAKSWWGNAWCQNLERYADYSSRIERGRSYVRNGSVIDLQITKGKVTSRVQGRRKSPYKIEVRISPLSEEKCTSILERCGKKPDTLEALVSGNFPEELKELFFQEDGLFPSPIEISFSCSCPDWALMCKHVAATLYGIGARFDENPLLFFELRGIDVDRFIDTAIHDRIEDMLSMADNRTSRMLDEEDLTRLFGVL